MMANTGTQLHVLESKQYPAYAAHERLSPSHFLGLQNN